MKLKKQLIIVVLITIAITIINLIGVGWGQTLPNLKYYFIYSAGFMLGNGLYYNLINKWVNWDKNPEKSLIISILGSIPVNALIYFCINLFFSMVFFHKSFDTVVQQQNIFEYIVVVLFSIVISLLIMIGYFFKTIREEKLKAEQLKLKNEQVKFESLKSQLDPHFLFNNLNVLTALIGENPSEAESFSIKLADIYRYVLDVKNEKLVSLQSEIDFAKKYLSLLKVRFEDDLQYNLPERIPQNAKMPPLSLQILLENAIKHNAISATQKLVINIKVVDNHLIVSNNKNKKKQQQEGHKIGLQNISKRYRLLSSSTVEIIDIADKFEIKLPLL